MRTLLLNSKLQNFFQKFQGRFAFLQLELENVSFANWFSIFHDLFFLTTEPCLWKQNSIRILIVKTVASCFPTLDATFLVTYFAFIQLLCGVLTFRNIKFFFLQALFLYFLHSVSECFSFFWNFIWTDWGDGKIGWWHSHYDVVLNGFPFARRTILKFHSPSFSIHWTVASSFDFVL